MNIILPSYYPPLINSEDNKGFLRSLYGVMNVQTRIRTAIITMYSYAKKLHTLYQIKGGNFSFLRNKRNTFPKTKVSYGPNSSYRGLCRNCSHKKSRNALLT